MSGLGDVREKKKSYNLNLLQQRAQLREPLAAFRINYQSQPIESFSASATVKDYLRMRQSFLPRLLPQGRRNLHENKEVYLQVVSTFHWVSKRMDMLLCTPSRYRVCCRQDKGSKNWVSQNILSDTHCCAMARTAQKVGSSNACMESWLTAGHVF